MTSEAMTAEFTDWADRAPDRTRGSVDEAELLLELLRDHLGVEDPAHLQPADLNELLLTVYPRKVTVLDEAELDDVIPTVRDLVVFLADTGRLPAGELEKLNKAVDWIEPRFVQAVMDPARWGPARAMVQAMAEDGVDMADSAAVNGWIKRFNDLLSGADHPAFGSGFDEDDDGDGDDDRVGLKEAFDLPDRLPPLRLPSEHELAAAARDVELLDQARRLALWLDERPRRLRSGELSAADAVSAAHAVGLEVPMPVPSDDAYSRMPAAPDVRRMADLPRIVLLWGLAESLGFIALDQASAAIGPGTADWPDGSDEDVLGVWSYALAHLLSRAVPDLDGPGRPWDLEDSGAGGMLLIMLFLGGGRGLQIAEIRDILERSATDTLPRYGEDWQSWARKNGDPAELLLAALTDLGAVSVTEDTVRLTPLSRYATRLQLLDSGVEVPLLPPPEAMTAADLIEFGNFASEDELEAEAAPWLERRPPEAVVDELLAVAADGEPQDRMTGVSLAIRVGAEAEQRWRQALDEPTLAPYAKLALAGFAGAEPGDVLPGLEPTLPDLAWMVTDTLAATAGQMEPDECAEHLKLTVPSGQEKLILEQIWRLDHPDAHHVLTTIGRHHPDKAVAKAARKAAYKNRPSARRP